MSSSINWKERRSWGVYCAEPSVNKSAVLFMDYNGHWAPLEYLYASSSSKVLVSRHPESCIEESQGFVYCPQCLTRFQPEEVKEFGYRCPTCLSCPLCECVLVVRVADDTLLEYYCDMCNWASRSIGVQGVNRLGLESAFQEKGRQTIDSANQAFQALLSAYRTADTQLLANRESRIATKKLDFSDYFYLSAGDDRASKVSSASSWRMCDLEDSLAQRSASCPYNPEMDSPLFAFLKGKESSLDSEQELIRKLASQSYATDLLALRQRSLLSPPGTNIMSINALPSRMPLLSKRTLRCRKDVEEGKLSIILQPKTLPLEGDSSQKLQKGKWWLKDSSAVHEVPRLTLRKLTVISSSLNEPQHIFAILSITLVNPRSSSLVVRLLRIDERYEQVAEDPSYALYRRRPPVTSAMEYFDLLEDSPTIEIGAFEDELLIEEEDGAKHVQMRDPDVSNAWRATVQHNVSFVDIPLTLSTYHQQSTPPAAVRAELSFILSLNPNDASATESRHFIKMLLADDIFRM